MTIESQLAALTAQTQALDVTITTELADVNTDVSAIRTRVTNLEIGSGPSTGGGTVGGSGSTTAGVEIVATLPPINNYEGRTVLLGSTLYVWNGTSWTEVVTPTTSDAPPGVVIVSSLPTSGTEGDVIFNRTDSYIYQRVNGLWVQVVVQVNTSTTVADASLTVAKFAAGLRPVEIFGSLPTTGNVAGRLVFLTTDNKLYRHNGTTFVASIPTTDLSGTITSDQITANAITTGKIAAGAVTASQIAADAVNAGKIAAGSITSDKIVANAITADKIAAGSISAAKIEANTITAGKIAAGAIGTSQLAAGAITAGSGIIENAAVETLKIAGNAVTQASSTYVGAQQNITSTGYTSVASIVIATSGTQPILVWASLGTPGAHIGNSSSYDQYFEGNYWKNNIAGAECLLQFQLGGYASGKIGSYTVLPAVTVGCSAGYVFSNIPAGTYTLSLQVAKADGGAENFAVRTISMSALETKR